MSKGIDGPTERLFPFPEFAARNGGEVPRFSGVIMDMDGVMLDSMGFWVNFDVDYARELGFEMDQTMAEQITAMGFRGTAAWFIETYGIDMTVQEQVQVFIDRAMDFYVNRVLGKPGAVAYVEQLKSRGVRLAAASSSALPIVEAGLNRLGLLETFDAVVSCDELGVTKETGEVYLAAAARMGVPIEECLVFEDITTALCSAKRAGAAGAGVLDGNKQQDTPSLRAAADFFVESFEDLLL